MKRHLITSVVALVVMVVALIAFGQEQNGQAQRRARNLDEKRKAIQTIQEQAAKMKLAFEEGVRLAESLRNQQDLSKEERTKLIEESTKRHEEWGKIIETIEQQIVILTPISQLIKKHEESIAELQAIRTLAEEEEAEKTIKQLKELIAKRGKEFGDTLEKLGIKALEPQKTYRQ